MHIVCPHCTTSYAIDLATLGGAGRTVRCSRCKEVWLARPEDAIEAAPVAAMAEAGNEAAAPARPTPARARGGRSAKGAADSGAAAIELDTRYSTAAVASLEARHVDGGA